MRRKLTRLALYTRPRGATSSIVMCKRACERALCAPPTHQANMLVISADCRSEEHTSELQSPVHLVHLHSFPTRRSSDLNKAKNLTKWSFVRCGRLPHAPQTDSLGALHPAPGRNLFDRDVQASVRACALRAAHPPSEHVSHFGRL